MARQRLWIWRVPRTAPYAVHAPYRVSAFEPEATDDWFYHPAQRSVCDEVESLIGRVLEVDDLLECEIRIIKEWYREET